MVYDRLRARLVPATMTAGDFRNHWKTHRGCGHFHMAFRALIRGQVRLAARGFRTIGRYGSTVGQGWTWLRTGNGRFGTMSGPAFYDKMAGRQVNGRTISPNE